MVLPCNRSLGLSDTHERRCASPVGVCVRRVVEEALHALAMVSVHNQSGVYLVLQNNGHLACGNCGIAHYPVARCIVVVRG